MKKNILIIVGVVVLCFGGGFLIGKSIYKSSNNVNSTDINSDYQEKESVSTECPECEACEECEKIECPTSTSTSLSEKEIYDKYFEYLNSYDDFEVISGDYNCSPNAKQYEIYAIKDGDLYSITYENGIIKTSVSNVKSYIKTRTDSCSDFSLIVLKNDGNVYKVSATTKFEIKKEELLVSGVGALGECDFDNKCTYYKANDYIKEYTFTVD